MVFNPTQMEIQTNMKIPLYYTGLKDVANISEQEGVYSTVKIKRDFSISLFIRLPALGITWFIIH